MKPQEFLSLPHTKRIAHQVRQARLHGALTALQQATPPPMGRGAVGVDLEGRTTLLLSAAGRVEWQTVGGDSICLFDPNDGLNARDARRVLRARASAPTNMRLHADVGGDVAFVELTCRWLAAALHLRTLRLLLEAPTRAAVKRAG
jgi:hypothetical protein